MKVQIQSIHFDADQRLLDFVENKLIKLSTFHDQVLSAEIYLRLEKNDERENKVVDIKLHIPGADLFAKRRANSFEAAADEVAEALRRQLLKQRKHRQVAA